MNACEMIARCARRQNPIPSRESSSQAARAQRYRVGTSNGHSAVDYSDLPSAMGVARALIEIGYAGVFVRDLFAATGEPEAWLWKPSASGGGQWVVFAKRDASPADRDGRPTRDGSR
jgi:hypothetical protein